MLESKKTMKSKATYSDDLTHRFLLEKTWGNGKNIVFIGINPSYTTELIMDNTTNNMTNYAIRNEYDRIKIVNLFSFRATKQDELKGYLKKEEENNLASIKT